MAKLLLARTFELDQDATNLLVETGEGTLRIGAVKPSGRRRMAAADWVRGRGAAAGDRFE